VVGSKEGEKLIILNARLETTVLLGTQRETYAYICIEKQINVST
jgi:hypothetical protein